MRARSANIKKFYDLLWAVQQEFGAWTFEEANQAARSGGFYPSGVYFLFEEQEFRDGRTDWGRVTRIGTHGVATTSTTSAPRLLKRLKDHFGRADGRRGASSIFREHVGNAITGTTNWWLNDDGSEKEISEIEGIHIKISEYIRKMKIVVIPINDAASKDSVRSKIECGAISLLTNYPYRDEYVINRPSASWLGNKCITKNVPDYVSRSGLWNVNEVDSLPIAGFLEVFEDAVGRARRELRA